MDAREVITLIDSARKQDILEKVTRCPNCMAPFNSFRKLYDSPVGTIRSVGVMRCENCSLVFKEYFPQKKLLEVIYEESYTHFKRPPEIEKLPLHQLQPLINRYTRLRLKQPAKILDVGCGNGLMVLVGLHLGYDCYGIDPFLPAVVNTHPTLSRRTARIDLMSDCIPKEWGKFDYITMWYVGEHLTHIAPFFRSLHDSLKDGGALSLLVPYGDSLACK